MAVWSCILTTVVLLAAVFFFFFNDTATTEVYTLSLHDALPICPRPGTHARDAARRWRRRGSSRRRRRTKAGAASHRPRAGDRKSTRLNSSHGYISYAVFCLKKKKRENDT